MKFRRMMPRRSLMAAYTSNKATQIELKVAKSVVARLGVG